MSVIVLRLGHRLKRDERITTHCGLVARAFGADEIIITGEEDKNAIKTITDVTDRWGGKFRAIYQKRWKKVIEEYKEKGFKIVHLTMYGVPVQKKINEIRGKSLLIIIGSEKVPGEIYGLSDFNIAVTNQPHSEVAALAIFLHEYFSGKELEKSFDNCKVKIVPKERGKKVVKV